jgi:NitT/TauT family transport system permease protein
LSNNSDRDTSVRSAEKVQDALKTASSLRLPEAGPSEKGIRVSETIFWRLSLGIVGLAIFVGIWEAYALYVADPVNVASPVSVAGSLYSLLLNHIPRGIVGVENIYTAILETLELVIIGFGISLLGIPVGFIMGRWRLAEAIADPWINALYAIPLVSLIPLIYLAQGGGTFAGELLVVFIFTFFTITLNTFHGVRYVSNSYAEVGNSFCATERQFIRHIVLPASLPDIVAGMRLGLGRSVLGSIVAEALLGFHGLGELMISFQSYTQTFYMMATITIIAIIGIFFLNTPKLVERRLFKWKEGERLSRNI